MSPSPTVSDSVALPLPAAGNSGAAVAREQNRWFHEEVHAHDAALRAYLRGSFPKMRDVEDVVQESYLRIWRARMARPIASTKSFLFQIARHFVIDTARRAQIAPTDSFGDLSVLPLLAEGPDAAEALTYAEKVRLLAEAMAGLPARCREVMILRKFQGVPQSEVAVRLGISERTVESQVTRGMRLVAERLRAGGVSGFSGDGR